MRFSAVCDLFQRLDKNRKSPKGRRNDQPIIQAWFDENRTQLARDRANASAVLSTLLPALRTDRVFELKEARLVRWFARAVALGCRRVEELRQMGVPGSGLDLGDCIEKILQQTVSPRSCGRRHGHVDADRPAKRPSARASGGDGRGDR